MDSYSDLILIALAALAVIQLVLVIWLLARRQPPPDHGDLLRVLATMGSASERTEHELRREIADSSRGARQETAQAFATFQRSLVQQGAEATRTQNAQLDAFSLQLASLQKTLADTLNTQLQSLSDANARRLSEVRATMETQLAQLQQTNAAKLDEMRKTVDEKLQSTLEARLGESFKQVADRLEQVHKGLGEMQTLAVGVGSLQRVLTNVKTRGVFGEVQLEALLEQVLTPEQYAKQVETKPRSGQRVDFAIRFPGRGDDGAPVWLPIDAKFPRDDYERLIDAHERADAAGAELAAKALEARIRTEAKSIADNYLAAPHTTDFAILFLPVESLYAEVLRRPGLMDAIQRQHRVTLAGPTTLLAMLNSLHMGFRTLALEQQASEVWKVLGAVKTEFERYGEWVSRIKEQVAKASDTLDKADTRARQMRLALRKVEALPDAQAQALLPSTGTDTDNENDKEGEDIP
ncbi:DNA recombination protein RmuC [Variovorax sp. J22G73]|uniref:DNA recombination protein RmuC n=1 Tax=unclassified Variovorax TaxID=663243 RepID=UPI000D5D1813|nr:MULTISPECIES: DNA recombination protein RmuC [unclassified Variovorax]MDM0003750.1 DNA recombination protein RmuC [Variovorax sp. J22R203]MDM0096584.1 DNA recombination protein RmuC [Variovorax sp. J22G73]